MSNGIYGYYDTKKEYVIYIGQDACIDNEKRHKDHLSPSNYDGQHINRVLQSNPDRYIYFKFIQGNFTQNEIDNFEKEAIKLLKTYKYDYPERNVFNFTPGGDFNPMKAPEIAKKMSESLSGENNPMYGKTHSVETRKKMSEATKGENNPFYGKHHSVEARKKISEANKGENHPMYGKTGENHPMYGKKHSQETCKKMSEARNTSGYYRVSKQRRNDYKQGFTWVYQYYTENGKQKNISSVDIKKLEEKVKGKKLKWEKIK